MDPETSISRTFKRPSAFLPIMMSLIAVMVMVVHLAAFGTAPQADEGTAAHLWQLLVAAQVPIMAFFVIKWAPQTPRTAFPVFAAQVAAALAALAALAPVCFLKW
ncbi:MAG: hypothetical protein EXS32_15040 [Opitutus sp.]|nr:hypothetical protein [Opitutus sp.]